MSEDNDATFSRVPALQNAEGIRVARQSAQSGGGVLWWNQTDLLNLAHDGIFVCDVNGTIRYWNRAAEELYGWKAEEAVDRVVCDLLKMVVPIPIEQITEEMLRTGRWQGDVVHTKKGGERIIAATRWSLQRDENGAPAGILATNNDITERNRTETLLAGEKHILEMVAKGDRLSHILESLCLLVEELAQDVLASVLLIEDGRLRHGGASSLPRAYIEVIDGVVIGPSVGSCGTAAYLAKQVIVSDIATDPLWTEFRDAALLHSLRACWSTPIVSSDGKVIGTFAMYYREPRSPSARDQTIIELINSLAGTVIQRKLLEEELQHSAAHLAEAQRRTNTGSYATDPRTNRMRYCSEELYRMFELDPREGVPTAEAFRQRVHPEDRDKLNENVQKAFREMSGDVNNFRIMLPDGTVRYIESRSQPLFNAKREIIEFVGIAVDVTERKRAEEEREKLRQLEGELARMSRVTVMGQLAASLAHELNQPLAAAINDANACLRWLSRDPPNLAEAKEAAMSVVADGTRAAEIIDRVRTLYKKGSPSMQQMVDVREVIREMLVLLRDEAERQSIAMRAELADFCPIIADRVQLQQVLMNLMLNGIEAMKETSGELTIKSQLAEDDSVLISVSDTGVGLPAEQADRIFDAFFTTKPHGIGMGLAISRSIIESHGGRMWAAGNAKRGATFYFTLPKTASAQAH